MEKRLVPYEDVLDRDLQDPEEPAAYLNAALEGEPEAGMVFLPVLRNVARTRGLRHLTQETRLNRGTPYRVLSGKGNPRFSTLAAVLTGIGLVRVRPATTKAA